MIVDSDGQLQWYWLVMGLFHLKNGNIGQIYRIKMDNLFTIFLNKIIFKFQNNGIMIIILVIIIKIIMIKNMGN